jgi:hypothetical protein
MSEAVSHRVLGAVRLIDAATGAQANDSFQVSAPGLKFARNRIGYYVIYGADRPEELREHADAFEQPPDTPPIGDETFSGQIIPAGRFYLPRGFSLDLPRDADPTHSDQPTSLFRPVDVQMYPAATSSVDPGWAVIRATARGTQAGQQPRPLGGALIRVLDAADNVIARGMTDWRGRIAGEALVVVPGIPVTISSGGNGGGPVLTHEIDVTLQVIFDPNAGAFPNPDDLEDNLGTLRTSTQDAQLASGRHLAILLTVSLD